MRVKGINHIAIVVPDIEAAQALYRDALGLETTHVERVDEEEVVVAFLPVGESQIELLEPLNETSGVARFMAKRGPGIHHICLEVEDIEATLAALKAGGAELINEEPKTGRGGRRYAFVHPKSTYGVLIELYEDAPSRPAGAGSFLKRLRTRFEIERRAIAAGIAAFREALRPPGIARSEDRVIGNGKRIPLKRVGEVLEGGGENGADERG
ncbi:MAG TPA: methylmalonyl-CoA epimerase [Chloroflexi bacterium]|nr:methylmalonyl-CoA epimerase [Chloroflexota bacterium]